MDVEKCVVVTKIVDDNPYSLTTNQVCIPISNIAFIEPYSNLAFSYCKIQSCSNPDVNRLNDSNFRPACIHLRNVASSDYSFLYTAESFEDIMDKCYKIAD